MDTIEKLEILIEFMCKSMTRDQIFEMYQYADKIDLDKKHLINYEGKSRL